MGRFDDVKPIEIEGVWYKAVAGNMCNDCCFFEDDSCSKPKNSDWVSLYGNSISCAGGFYILKKCDKDGVITNSKSTNEIEQEVNVTQAKDETEVLVNAFGKEVARNYYLCRSFLVREFSERHEADFLRIAKELE